MQCATLGLMPSTSQAVVTALLEGNPLEALPRPRRLRLNTSLTTAGASGVLVVGGDIPDEARLTLLEYGHTIEIVSTVPDALQRMRKQRFISVAVHANVQEDGDGIRFVQAFKRSLHLGSTSVLELARHFSTVPFVILPLTGTTEYAIFWSICDWWLGDECMVSLSDALLGKVAPVVARR